jgi:hypothetical protein
MCQSLVLERSRLSRNAKLSVLAMDIHDAQVFDVIRIKIRYGGGLALLVQRVSRRLKSGRGDQLGKERVAGLCEHGVTVPHDFLGDEAP